MASSGRSRRSCKLLVLLIASSFVFLLPSFSTTTVIGSDSGPPPTRADNNTTGNQPPEILTDEIPVLVVGEPYYHEMEAIDDSTPIEFLTWDVEHEDSSYYDSNFYMEGNILKGGPFWDVYKDLELEITVWDHEGESQTRTYEAEIDWEDEPPEIIKLPPFRSTGKNELYFKVGTEETADIQYSDPENQTVWISRSRSDRSDYYSEYSRDTEILKISRHSAKFGKGTIELDLDDGDNEVSFTLEFEFQRYDGFSSSDYHIVDLSGNDGFYDNREIVFGVAIRGSNEPLLYNISNLVWDGNRTSERQDDLIYRDLLYPGHHNISVTFNVDEKPYSDQVTIWIHFRVIKSGTMDVEDKDDNNEGSISSDLCLIGVFLPILILIPMGILYVLGFMIRRKPRGGEEE